MKTLRLHILRHGLTQGNLDGLYVGHTDLPLCEAGRAQLLQMKEAYRYPASSFVQYYGGSHLIIINRDRTPQDARAELVIHEPIGQVFSAC